jgi:hypothetical protein
MFKRAKCIYEIYIRGDYSCNNNMVGWFLIREYTTKKAIKRALVTMADLGFSTNGYSNGQVKIESISLILDIPEHHDVADIEYFSQIDAIGILKYKVNKNGVKVDKI